MNKSLKIVLQIISILIGAILIGTLLLIFVFKLPTHEMKNNVRRSTAIYDYEGVYPQLMGGYKMSQLDNSTDATMLLNVIYPGSGDTVKDAMNIYRIEYPERHPVGSLTDYANDVKKETYTISYPRYWHGYLVILKPLLLFFDVADIRIFNMFLFFAVLIYIVCLMKEQGLDKYILWFGITILILNPLTIPVSFQFSTVTYIALLSCILVLKGDFKDIKKQIFFFMIIGIVTAYFDFFTFPLVGLYFPMIFLLIKEKNWKKALQTVVLGSVMWIIGYAGMWGGKWLVGSLLTGGNFFVDALSRAEHYAGNTEYTRLQIIWKNVKVLIKWPIVVIGSLVLIKILKELIMGIKMKAVDCKLFLPFGIIMTAPFVWYLVAGSHSYIHYWFTYRELCVAILALLIGIQRSLDNKAIN